MILTGYKCSGKMSLYERDNHLEHPRTETSDVLNRLLVGQLTAAEAAVLLNLPERQVRRLYAAYRKDAAA